MVISIHHFNLISTLLIRSAWNGLTSGQVIYAYASKVVKPLLIYEIAGNYKTFIFEVHRKNHRKFWLLSERVYCSFLSQSSYTVYISV